MRSPSASLRAILASLAILACGIAAALVSHALLWAIESMHLLGAAYLDHKHTSVAPLLAAVFAVAAAVAMLYLAQAIDGGSRRSVIALAREFGESPWLGSLATTSIALGTLRSMEAFEGSDAAFGSMPCIGIALVAAVALCVAGAARAFARWIAAATQSVVRALLTFLRRSALPVRARALRCRRVVQGGSSLEFPQIHGLRAPPRVLA